VASIHDSSAPQLSSFAESAEAVKVYQEQVLDINIEHWYELIPEFTFRTEFVAISIAAGQLFVDSYLAYEEHKKQILFETLDASAVFVPPADIQSRTDELLLRPLQAAVERVRRGADAPVFIKVGPLLRWSPLVVLCGLLLTVGRG
jgi:hypothetical protein